MSAQQPDYEEQRADLIESIERDQEEVRAAVQELANVASDKVQELTTVASDKVQELATAASDKVQELTDVASDKLEVFDIGERIREFPVRWLLAAFAVGVWLGVRSDRPIVFTEQRRLR
jgi:hypothetical protein